MQSTPQKLIKNTFYMYVRMFLLLVISLYTSRVLLKELGIVDYGVYNLVASIIALFSSIKVMFTSSTQRFLNTDMGNGGHRLGSIFNISLLINGALATFFVLLVEIVGLWFLNFQMNVPDDRVSAAHYLFQVSIVITILAIMSTPFEAVIISHERFDFYAGISIVEGIGKLLIIYVLFIFTIDKLILYALLLLFVQCFVFLGYYVYCKKTYPECRQKFGIDRDLTKEMTSFAGWQFFGNTAFTLTNQGVNLVLNIFGGPVVNAARGIAVQVDSALKNFQNNIFLALNPHCMILFGENKIKEMYSMIYLMSKILFLVQCCLIVPFILFTDEILNLWLSVVPDYTVVFLQIILIWSLIRTLHSPIDTLFKSYGKIKHYQLVEGVIYGLPVLLSYIVLKFGAPYYTVFIISIMIEILTLVSILIVAKIVVGFNIKNYLVKVIGPCFYSIIMPSVIVAFSILHDDKGVLYRILLCSVSILFSITSMFYSGFSKEERQAIYSLVYNFVKKNKV